MQIYDSLLIGSGYGAIGYAAAHKNTIVCEEHQICDTSFYLPLRTFTYEPYRPKTAEGKALQGIFENLDLFNGNEQNTNCFEFALCRYITEKEIKVLLKCRVISAEKRADEIFDVTIQTNAGLSHILTKRILRVTPNDLQQKHITVLFTANDYATATDELLSVFPSSHVERAFYNDRRALHIPMKILGEHLDENDVKVAIYQKWHALSDNAKIIYISPVFYGQSPDEPLNDGRFGNPIEAFENGYFFAEKEYK